MDEFDSIKVLNFREHDDGSAIVQLEMSEFVKNVLIEKALLTLIKAEIDSLKHTEHLK